MVNGYVIVKKQDQLMESQAEKLMVDVDFINEDAEFNVGQVKGMIGQDKSKTKEGMLEQSHMGASSSKNVTPIVGAIEERLPGRHMDGEIKKFVMHLTMETKLGRE